MSSKYRSDGRQDASRILLAASPEAGSSSLQYKLNCFMGKTLKEVNLCN
jgi:hypothetical protein